MQSNFGAKLHVGIIMDGNGRWATRRGLSRLRGHEAGVEAIRRIVEAAPDRGVGTLTLYAFSTDNWRRPRAEVAALMALLRFYLASEVESLVKNGVRLTAMPAWASSDHGSAHDDLDSWKLVRFIRHLPTLTFDEKKEMEKLNPKGPEDRKEEEEEEKFLKGEDIHDPQTEHHHH